MDSIILLLTKSSFLFINIFTIVFTFFKKRDKKQVVIGAWDGLRYADNSRYLFEYLSDRHDYIVTWATKSKDIYKLLKEQGKSVVMIGTFRSFKVHIRAYYHIVCTAYADISGEYSWGAFKVNLWHGMPIKLVSKLANKSGYKQRTFIHDTKLFAKIKEINIFNPGGWNNCFYISPGTASDKQLLEDFQIDQKWIIHTNYPRNLAKHGLKWENLVCDLIKKHNFSIIYLPTFRENNNDSLFDPIENQEIRSVLKTYDVLWLDKKHFASMQNDKKFGEDDNVLHLKTSFDIYSILQLVDIVITDYSSVYYDALYYLKNIILYMPDYEYYKNSDRGFLIDPSTLKGCSKTYNVKDLISEIKNILEKRESKDYDIEKIKSFYWVYTSGTMSDIWGTIIEKE